MNAETESTGFDPSSFVALVSGLGAQAKILMGLMENPISGQYEDQDLSRARTLISTVEMLSDKTKGNLSDEEQRFLMAVLTDLRMRYVEKCGD